MYVGAEVAEADERFAAGVFDVDAAGDGVVRDENFVLGNCAETDHDGCLDFQASDAAAALHRNPTASARILQLALSARFERQLLRAEPLLAVDCAVHDPAV